MRTVHPQSRRQPFEAWQPERIFSAPIYTGCQVEQKGYADGRNIGGIACFVISEDCPTGLRGKSLETRTSERIAPILPQPLAPGIMAFVDEKRRCGGDFRNSKYGAWAARHGNRPDSAGFSYNSTC